ncbi:MAG: hypothetical protein IGR76_14765 [Synechococcales cyanobacterium T60_A2020_003]|nr:hypothetical protein [Synechococcales cyanobacterium T60_A2020_003]
MPSSSSNLLPETPQDAPPLLPELIEHLPNLAGWEAYLPSTKRLPIARSSQPWDMQQIKGVFAIALHMHQPIVPAGENGELISYLQYMFAHPFEGNNFNAGAFTYCYTRIADFLIAITMTTARLKNCVSPLTESGIELLGLLRLTQWGVAKR